MGGGNLNEAERGTRETGKGGGEALKVGPAVGEGGLMTDEGVSVTDGDDIIMEDPGIDGGGGLLEKDDLVRVEAMEAGDGTAGLEGLAGGETAWAREKGIERAAAIDKEVEAFSGGTGEAGMVGGSFIGHGLSAGEGRMKTEPARIGKEELKETEGKGSLNGAMEVGEKIRGGEMSPAIGGVTGGGHGAGVGGPHGGGGGGGSEEEGVLAGGAGEDGGRIWARKSPAFQAFDGGSFVRGEDGLGDSPGCEGAGLVEALESGFTRFGNTGLAGFGGEVAMGEPGVVVGGSDKPVKIDFPVIHGGAQVRLNRWKGKRATGFCH